MRPTSEHGLSTHVERSLQEWRSPRFAELDGQIRAEAGRHQNRPRPKRKPRPRSAPPLPGALRKEITHLARGLRRKHSRLFINDPKLKDRAARLFRSQLPPWGKRGARGYDDVTTAIQLLRKFRWHYARQYPDEKPHQIGKRVWKRICPEVIPSYGAMAEQDQRDAREGLRTRVRDRLNKRRRRAGRKTESANSPPVQPSQSV
jgi:hypothetical protein